MLFNVDWYRNRSSSQLVNYTVPPTTGFPSILRNLPAVVGNEGWEFVLNTVNVKGTAFSWSTALNVTVPKNKLVSFPDFVNSSYNNTYVIGQPLSIHKVYRYLGVDTHTGLYTFADKEGKPTSAPTPIVDQTSLVNTDRRWYGGLSNTFRYKGLQLIVLLQYVHQKNYDIAVYGQPPGAVGNFVTKVMSRWQKEGDKTTIQRFTQNTSTDAYTAGMYVIDSERAFADGNFLRVKNVSLSYDLGKGIAGRLHSKALRVYVNAQNLLTVTPYSGADPETGGSGFLPPMRTIVGGIQCTF